jgi:hypothetical protein
MRYTLANDFHGRINTEGDRKLKIFRLFLAACFLALFIFPAAAPAADPWTLPDPLQGMTGTGSETLSVSSDLNLPLESGPINQGLKFDHLLAQTKPGSAGSMASGPDTGASTSEMDEQAKIAEAMLNPLSYLWLMFMQNDTSWYDGDILDRLGENTKAMNTTLLMPVLSIQLTEKWKTILRPIIPINSFDTVGNVDISTGTVPGITGVDLDRETGLGDIVLWTAFSNQYTAPFIWGLGPTVMMDTATEDQLGSGKWSAGPMALAFHISEKWVLGGIFQHWWSFAGDDDWTVNTNLGPVTVERPDVNLTDFQYILRYRLSPTTNIGMGPNIRYNWETEELSLPVGIGGDFLVKLGPLPVKIGAELHYYVEQDDRFGPQWLFRFFFVPVLPSPKWSQKPLF